jgi:hypothetical protein
MNVNRKWVSYIIAGLVLLALAQFAVVGAGIAGWFGH